MSHYIYILESNNGKLYTGYTTDLERRFKEHKSGKGAKFTTAFGAKKLRYSESFTSKSDALKREYQIKQLSRSEKLQLIKKD